MVTEKTAKIYFGLLKSIILTDEMKEKLQGYPKLVIYDKLPGLHGVCNDNLTIGISRKTLEKYNDEFILEVLAHELFHFMMPGLRVYTEDDFEIDASELNAQTMAVETCKKILIGDAFAPSKYTNPTNILKLYKPITAEYWIARQLHSLRFRPYEKSEESDKLFNMLMARLTLESDLDIVIKEDENETSYTLLTIPIRELLSRVDSLEDGEYYDVELDDEYMCITCTAHINKPSMTARILNWRLSHKSTVFVASSDEEENSFKESYGE